MDKAFPGLEDNGIEKLVLNHFVSLIDNSEVAFCVRLKHLRTVVDEAVSATLEMEAYINTKTISSVMQVEAESSSGKWRGLNGGLDEAVH